MSLEVQERNDAGGERPALEQALVRLELRLRRLPRRAVASDVLELEDARLLLLKPKHHRAGEDRPRGEAPDDHDEERPQKHMQHGPPVPEENSPVVPEMRLGHRRTVLHVFLGTLLIVIVWSLTARPVFT